MIWVATASYAYDDQRFDCVGVGLTQELALRGLKYEIKRKWEQELKQEVNDIDDILSKQFSEPRYHEVPMQTA